MIYSRYGCVCIHDKSDIISSFISSYGEWAFLECEFVAAQLTPQAKVFDLGAFIGTFTLGLNTLLAEGQYLAAELNPECWPILEHNLVGNVTKAKLFKGAIGSSSSEDAAITLSWEEGNQGTTSMHNPAACHKTIHVPTATIAHLAHQHFIPDLIKLDLEGAELPALKYSQTWLSQHKPMLWIECNENPDSLGVYAWLNWMGYKVHYFAFPSHNPDNFLNNPEALYPFAYEAGLFASCSDNAPALAANLTNKGCILEPINSKADLKKALWHTPRWSHKNWRNLSQAQLIALLTHYDKNISYADFLKK